MLAPGNPSFLSLTIPVIENVFCALTIIEANRNSREASKLLIITANVNKSNNIVNAS